VAGYELSSKESKDLGGVSGLVFNGNKDLIFISDRSGYFVESAVTFAANNTMHIQSSITGTIKDNNGITLQGYDTDTEDIAYFNGDCFVTHEIINKISLYRGCNFESSSFIKTPSALKELHKSAGMESLGITKSGRFLTVAEYDASGDHYLHKAFMWGYKSSDCTEIEGEIPFYYESSQGYGVVSLTFTEEGNLLVLERKYKKDNNTQNTDRFLVFETKVKFIPKKSVDNIISGSTLSGQEIIYIFNENGKSTISDNYEAITTKKLSDGSTAILIVSDDNLLPVEKTFLLQFNVNENNLENYLNTHNDCSATIAGVHIEMPYDMFTTN